MTNYVSSKRLVDVVVLFSKDRRRVIGGITLNVNIIKNWFKYIFVFNNRYRNQIIKIKLK